MLSLPVRDLVARFNGVEGIERYAKILRDLTLADEKDQKIRERRGANIEKSFVAARLFGYVNNLMSQILEYPEVDAEPIIALVNSGGDDMRARLVEKMRDSLGSIIGGAKEGIINELEALKDKSAAQKTGVEEYEEGLVGTA